MDGLCAQLRTNLVATKQDFGVRTFIQASVKVLADFEILPNTERITSSFYSQYAVLAGRSIGVSRTLLGGWL